MASRAARLWLPAALAALLLALAAPTLLWAYHLEAAGRLLERGLAWPAPRLSDSLPAVGDAASLAEADAHLAEARRWRPGHPYALRLAGQVALARRDWRAAAAALEEARARSPRSPLAAWEAGLAYEQIWLADPADAGARASALAAWRAAGITPEQLHARGDEAAADPQAAARWHRRAQALAATP